MRHRQVERAVKAAPATIEKRSHRRDPKRFDAYTVSRLLEEYRDPRAILLEIASMDTHALAHLMCGKLVDDITGKPILGPGAMAQAIAERRLCAQAVLPYVAQKLPVQVDMRHTKAIHLNIVDERQFTELLNLADTDALDPNDQVQLVQGLVIDNDTPDQGTAARDQPTDAHVHAEQSDSTAQHTLALNSTSTAPVDADE